jgi:DnaJ-class molecular chaperone
VTDSTLPEPPDSSERISHPDEHTEPDIASMRCPECGGAGEVVSETYEDGHIKQAGRRTCETCWGKSFVDRETFDRWRKRHGIESTPPKS